MPRVIKTKAGKRSAGTESVASKGEMALALMQQSFVQYLSHIPALFWRLDIIKNEIIILSQEDPTELGENVILLLQNQQYAQDMVVEADKDRFFKCLEQLRQRQHVSTIFRIRNHEGIVRWVTLMGMADPEMSCCTIGLLADCSNLAETAIGADNDISLADKIELFDNPVLLIRFGDRRVILANTKASRCFAMSRTGPQPTFDQFLAGSADDHLPEIYESLIFAERWNGSLIIVDGRRQSHLCKVSIRPYARGRENLLWVSLVPSQDGIVAPERDDGLLWLPFAEMETAFDACDGIRPLLRAVLNSQTGERRFDAAILSRIFVRDHVLTTGEGALFAQNLEDELFPYEGTIAENMVNFGLSHVIVKDTTRSIKPIDWALFIPHGVRSYFAMPFFENGILKNVVTFCSAQASWFSEGDASAFQVLRPILSKTLARILPAAGHGVSQE